MSEESKNFWSTFMDVRLDMDQTDPTFVFWMSSSTYKERYEIFCKNKETLRQSSTVLTYREVEATNPESVKTMLGSAMDALMRQVNLMDDPASFVAIFCHVAKELEAKTPGLVLLIEEVPWPFKYMIKITFDEYTTTHHVTINSLIEMTQSYETFIRKTVETSLRPLIDRAMKRMVGES